MAYQKTAAEIENERVIEANPKLAKEIREGGHYKYMRDVVYADFPRKGSLLRMFIADIIRSRTGAFFNG